MIFIIWFVAAMIVSLMAKGTGRSAGIWFVMSIILTPVLAFVVLVATSGK
ncbi:hypothetical protein NRE35_004264 [Salmonella enterica]|nr:hypothetical protein [Escherichia coli]EJO2543898.1 hypothetical protein [Salmonella enterica]ELF5187116.1 hypothetical protein [Salmonella enterica]